MRKLILPLFVVLFAAAPALAQSQEAPTLRIVSEAGNDLPAELLYGNTRVRPLRLRPGTNQPITIADSDFFVQQQYVDFLSRFPDERGFNFWLTQINNCGSDARCADRARVNTSGAFFLSIEFQETGYFVYRLNRASFGDRPRYASFMPDSRQIASGVVVGEGDWQGRLESNRRSFLNAWVSRASFQAEYPASLTATEFVDKLLQRAGLSVTAAERNALITQYGNGDTASRAAVLRSIAENGTFTARERNPAFVLMQYFGYLRRDPDEAGFNFWLGKLNEFNGDFHAAEMVRAFIVSQEYSSRF